MVPVVAGSRPATSRSSVDLPQPLGPSSATNSPGCTVRSMPSITCRTPVGTLNQWLTSRMSMRAPADARAAAGATAARAAVLTI